MNKTSLKMVAILGVLTIGGLAAAAQTPQTVERMQQLRRNAPELGDSPCDQALKNVLMQIKTRVQSVLREGSMEELTQVDLKAHHLAETHQSCRKAERAIREAQGTQDEKRASESKAEAQSHINTMREIGNSLAG
ncbi:MAG: hypothetical protein KGQ59_08110 [Bdellovibrionales bacterium]|nr:hypothetical protein [Bdellovibrionales bacterium]